jgi:hypothetical protein
VRLDGLARIFGKFLANSFSRVNAMGDGIRNTRMNTGDLWWAWVDLNHRPRPYQECRLRHVFAAIIEVRGFDPLKSSLYVFGAGAVFLRPFKAAHERD